MEKIENSSVFPMLALRDLVIFPHMVTHFDAGRSKSIRAIEEAEVRGGKIFLVAQRQIEIENPTKEDLYEVGTIAVIKQTLKLPGGIVRVLVEGLTRGIFKRMDETDGYHFAEVVPYEDPEEIIMDPELEAILRLTKNDLEQYIETNSKLFPGLLDSVIIHDHPGAFADTAGGYIDLKLEDSQRLLEALDIKDRLIILHEVLAKEVELLSIENQIDQKVKVSLNKTQKEYYLKEQMRAIREELGDSIIDEQEAEDEYVQRLNEKELPEEVREKAENELKKLRRIQSSSPEYAGITNYLDWILDLPWLDEKAEDIDIKEARRILDEDHYGLQDIKERILEFIAVRKKSGDTKGPILCLVGPPGVGKTSVARSVARALDKAYVRMSLGGITDESEIRGHRRTYVGSMPGRIISLMKKAEQNNPLFLLDEIDKVGNDYRGDPASGLLEVLDPAQNNTFTDRYMELPFDLSKVFFITTANTTRTIPAPLLDRLEVIEIGGYTPEEKFNIAKRHLLPRQMKDAGLSEEEFSISDNAIKALIDYYTREAGVRALEKELSKILRKAALQMLEEDRDRVSVTKRNLNKYVGEERFSFDLVSAENPIGKVNGLAWTQVGGETLNIEANVLPGKGKIKLTGQLGDVMKESGEAALSYLISNSEKYDIPKDFMEDHHVHIHVPAGATPKDGPSAGISIATALYSAITKTPIRGDVAMTGEVTLRGSVLPIGGLKEKLLAAHRMGIKKVLVPKKNEPDLKEIDSPSLKALEIVFVETMDEVLKEAIALED